MDTYFTHIFRIIFSAFLKVRLIDLIEVKTSLLFRFPIFYGIIQDETLKMFEDNKI